MSVKNVASELVSQLATKTTVAHATLRKFKDRDDPECKRLKYIIEDSMDLLKRLQFEINTTDTTGY